MCKETKESKNDTKQDFEYNLKILNGLIKKGEKKLLKINRNGTI